MSVNLQFGNSGNEVKNLQETLNRFLPRKIAVDGAFGIETEKAVKEFQQLKGLSNDGVAGIDTLTALNTEKIPSFQSPSSSPINKRETIIIYGNSPEAIILASTLKKESPNTRIVLARAEKENEPFGSVLTEGNLT